MAEAVRSAASYLSVDVPNVVVSVVKKAEVGNDIIIRAYETAGRPVRATLDIGLMKRRWSGNFRPLEIKTLRVPMQREEKFAKSTYWNSEAWCSDPLEPWTPNPE